MICKTNIDNFEIEKMSIDLKSLNHIIEKTPYDYDCYFIDDEKYRYIHNEPL